LTQFRASWRPEKAIFPNLKEIALSAEKAIFTNQKVIDFQGARTTLSQFRASWQLEKANFRT
jgi:hypothetical protein